MDGETTTIGTLAFSRLRADLLAVGEFDKPKDAAEAFGRLHADLFSAYEAESRIDRIALLEASWPSFEGAIAKAAQAIENLRQLMGDKWKLEPATLGIDLLGALARGRKEVLHTRAIGTLLAAPCPFRDSLVQGLVLNMPEIDKICIESVEVEPWRSTGLGRQLRWVRPDLVVHVVGGQVLTIENKIDAGDRERQLDDYLDCMKGDDVIAFIYLTPDGRGPGASTPAGWRLLSYQELAVAWRRTLAVAERTAPDDPWTWLLRLYLATVVQELWGIRLDPVTGRPSDREKPPVQLRAYLEAALEEGT